jgi:hypothetical protein
MLASGAWLISVTDASLLSVDQLIIRIYHKSQTSLHADKARA